MSTPERFLHHCANILVGGTGLVYAWMLYFATPTDEFSIWNHPWQGGFHDAHVLLAPFLVLTFGVVWNSHAGARLRRGNGSNRFSGIGMLVTFIPMVCSGYLLQVTVEESWRVAWLWIHLASSGLWLAAYLFHVLFKRGSGDAHVTR